MDRTFDAPKTQATQLDLTTPPEQACSATQRASMNWPLRSAAVGFAERGLRIFPLIPGTKRPIKSKPHPDDQPLPLADWQDPTKGGFHQGHRDPGLVRGEWMVYTRDGAEPDIGYAHDPTVIVIDVDNPAQLLTENPALEAALDDADTYVVRTGGGNGRAHFHFRKPESCNLDFPQNVNYPVPGVDSKPGGKGLVKLPPSAGYEYERGDPTKLADLPDIWIQAFADAATATATGSTPRRAGGQLKGFHVIERSGRIWRAGGSTETWEAELHAAVDIDDGERDDRLYRALCRLVKSAKSAGELIAIGKGLNATYNPPLAEAVAVEKGERVWREFGEPKTEPAPDTGPAPNPKPAPDTKPAPEPEPGPKAAPEPDEETKIKVDRSTKGIARALRKMNISIYRVLPSDHNVIVFPEEKHVVHKLEIGSRADRKLILRLRERVIDGYGKPMYEPSPIMREAYYDAIADLVPPVMDDSQSDDPRHLIECAVDGLPEDAVVRPMDVALAANVIHHNEAPARVKSICSLVRKILRERRFKAGDPVFTWWTFNAVQDRWFQVTRLSSARCWKAPRGWEQAAPKAVQDAKRRARNLRSVENVENRRAS